MNKDCIVDWRGLDGWRENNDGALGSVLLSSVSLIAVDPFPLNGL